MPPLPGTEVRRATGAERDEALDLVDVERRLPAGLSRDGEPVVLDLDFIDGTKGAHVNISGISGVATKTSYATFLLYSLFHSGVLGRRRHQHEGADLQRQGRGPPLPRPRQHQARRRQHACTYQRLGLEAEAVPHRPHPRPAPQGRSQRHARHRRPHDRGPAALLDHRPVLRAGAAAVPLRRRRGRAPAVHDRRPVGRRPAAAPRHGEATPRDGAVRIDGETARTFADLIRLVESKLIPDDPDEPADPRWTGRAIGAGTINAFVRRLASCRAPRRAPDPGRHRRRRHARHRPRRAAGHRRRPPHAPRPRQAVRRRRRAAPGVRRQGGVGHRRAAAVRRARRAQQVRAPRLVEPDQGDPARRRRAGPQPRHDPDRRPADRERGRAPGRRQLGGARRRPPRRGRGRARAVRLPAGGAAPAGDDPQAGLDVRLPAPPARSRCCSSSRSRPGRPAAAEADLHAHAAAHAIGTASRTTAAAATRSTGSRSRWERR